MCALTAGPTGEIVHKINSDISKEVQEEMKVYLPIDKIMDTEQSSSYPAEFLNSLELSGVPSHKLQLKLGVPVMLMRNIDAPRLCNGTRLRVTHLGQNIIGATILTGVGKGESVIIPRIPITPTDLYHFNSKGSSFQSNLVLLLRLTKRRGKHYK